MSEESLVYKAGQSLTLGEVVAAEKDEYQANSAEQPSQSALIANVLERCITSEKPHFQIFGEIGIPAPVIEDVFDVSRPIAVEGLRILEGKGYLRNRERKKKPYQVVSVKPTLPPKTWRSARISHSQYLGDWDGHGTLAMEPNTGGDAIAAAIEYLGAVKVARSMERGDADAVDKGVGALQAMLNKHPESPLPYATLLRTRSIEQSRGAEHIFNAEQTIIVTDSGDGFARRVRNASPKDFRLYKHLEQMPEVQKDKIIACTSAVEIVEADDIPIQLREVSNESHHARRAPNSTHFLRISTAHFVCPLGLIAVTASWVDPQYATIHAADYSLTLGA